MIPNTVEIWRGPSEIDGAPIVLLASGLRGTSANRKTGPMVQTWILRQDVSPVDAVRSGADASICGSCRHRGSSGFSGRTCYVNVGQAPSSIWRSWRAGKVRPVPQLPEYAIAGHYNQLGYVPRLRHPLRLGAYGDPLAVPLAVWSPWIVASMEHGHTGYTHQWATIGRRSPDWRWWVMASVDSAAEAMLARAMGWRYFRVYGGESEPLPSELECVNTTHGRTCADCQLCGGDHRASWRTAEGFKVSGAAPSIRIAAHGAGAVNFGR